MPSTLLADTLKDYSTHDRDTAVTLSQSLVTLLSEQLYKSPVKAIEELVVNSYDADATECRLAIPSPSDLTELEESFIAVLDNGKGMDKDSLVNLWCIGHSLKRDADYTKRFTRKQIGKFGIGKLASYAVASRLTYISKTASGIRGVSMDFGSFAADDPSSSSNIHLPIHDVKDWAGLQQTARFKEICVNLGVDESYFSGSNWTLAILESLKDKALKMKLGRVKWVLSTAMPLKVDFSLFLNTDVVESAKEDYERLVEFSFSDLPPKRVKALGELTAQNWEIKNGALVSEAFPQGIRGTAIVCEKSLLGKSDDLRRSYGFFIRVRGRLINEDDPLFGLEPLSHQTFNHFRADVEADDLDAYLLSSREELEAADMQRTFKQVLSEVFREARARRDEHFDTLFKKERTKKEGERPFVEPRLVEHPIADVLSVALKSNGTDADDKWFYLSEVDEAKTNGLLQELYSAARKAFSYDYNSLGPSARLVKLDIETREFVLNSDHEYVRAAYDDPRARQMLEDFATSEVLLEVYLRESAVPPVVCGEILERRDLLLRGLAKDHAVSLKVLAQDLRDSAADQYMLEIALVRGMRAIGFVAKHISGSGEPDGVARLVSYPDRSDKLTLEAKSSVELPELSALDFAGLAQHMRDYKAQGCIVVAPKYPGAAKGADSAVFKRAKAACVSCWTIEQFASVVENAESRHITAAEVLQIIKSANTPDEVASAVERLLSDPQRDMRSLYIAILTQLRALEGKISASPRTFDMLVGRLIDVPGFDSVQVNDVKKACMELAGASRGALLVSGDTIKALTSLDEIERRVAHLTGSNGPPRSRGPFRNDSFGEEKTDLASPKD